MEAGRHVILTGDVIQFLWHKHVYVGFVVGIHDECVLVSIGEPVPYLVHRDYILNSTLILNH